MLRGRAVPPYSAPPISRPPRCRDSIIPRACSYTAADHRRQLQKVGVDAEQASVHAEMTTAASKQAKQETTSEMAPSLSLLTQKTDVLGAKMEALEDSLGSKLSKQENLLVTKLDKVDGDLQALSKDLQALSKDLLSVKLNTRWGLVLLLVVIMVMSGAFDITKTLLWKLLQF
ncbi:hypothetical protein COCSUDRAFT_34168 [Coccomyxa subellipsoidea C-169]|uniref:Uncharacterized protein n=1 Tax=Coccomyxa subellipsoidea (strain C-169) TaxID=574566 RepID=I0YMD7_COCSC|nr:hypothetical protein COCSUDRAFT_34168 [Coccomyxa subellipsoidea C-169]EIE19556.1 hypothetical protein COCSUDRAFT_34168 [Coccomyxa subellipsoidea C-169]|eukprot:XP_005644100.1 hypothetical protein COCSUDRAFT_34168 [Coccomyxa subellipsoidea C-169]